jgi:hypothetical protein
MTPTELKTVLENHAKWLAGGSHYSFTNRADLCCADLRCSNLTGANLRSALLSRTRLSGANLSGADLSYAVLDSADLSGANLSGANLSNASLVRASLAGADLTGANLSGADLTGANLSGAKLPDFQICPQNESFIGYKKVWSEESGGVVLKLRIEGPRTNSLVGRKCRTSKAFVLEAIGSTEKVFKSLHNRYFPYEVGQYAEEPLYNSDIRIECTRGIHFFMAEEEARAY